MRKENIYHNGDLHTTFIVDILLRGAGRGKSQPRINAWIFIRLRESSIYYLRFLAQDFLFNTAFVPNHQQ